MISFLSGEIRNIFTEKSILEINVSGVGYEIALPSFVMDDIVNTGKKSGENIKMLRSIFTIAAMQHIDFTNYYQ